MDVDTRARQAAETLHDATRGLDADRMLLDLHRTRERRTRARVVAGAVGVCLAAVVATAVVDLGTPDSAPPTDPAPGPPTVPDRVLTIDDAVHVRPEVILEQVLPGAAHQPFLDWEDLSDDGRVLTHRVTESFRHQPGLLDPATGETTWFDPPPTSGGLGLGTPIELSEGRIVFAQGLGHVMNRVNVLVLDRGTGTWSVSRVSGIEPGVDAHGWYPFMAPDGRMWFRGGLEDGEEAPAQWWSASTTESGPARLEQTDVPAWGFGQGRLLARVDLAGRLVVEDLADGTRWSARPFAGCEAGGVTMVGTDHVLVPQTCPAGQALAVFSADGEDVLSVEGDVGLAQLGVRLDSTLVGMPTQGSRYLLDLSEQRLLRIDSGGCGANVPPARSWAGLLMWCAGSTAPSAPGAREFTYRIATWPSAPSAE